MKVLKGLKEWKKRYQKVVEVSGKVKAVQEVTGKTWRCCKGVN